MVKTVKFFTNETIDFPKNMYCIVSFEKLSVAQNVTILAFEFPFADFVLEVIVQTCLALENRLRLYQGI